jgi:hypothetical protein
MGGSPSEALSVDTVAGDAGGGNEVLESRRPGVRAAKEDVTLCEVGNPPLQRRQFVGDTRTSRQQMTKPSAMPLR